jgi:hypothetical protein
VCQFCEERGLTCDWDIPSGLSRNEDLRRKLREVEGFCKDSQLLIKALRLESIETSTMLLAKLRMGVSLLDLADSLRNGTVDAHQLQHSARSGCY